MGDALIERFVRPNRLYEEKIRVRPKAEVGELIECSKRAIASMEKNIEERRVRFARWNALESPLPRQSKNRRKAKSTICLMMKKYEEMSR